MSRSLLSLPSRAARQTPAPGWAELESCPQPAERPRRGRSTPQGSQGGSDDATHERGEAAYGTSRNYVPRYQTSDAGVGLYFLGGAGGHTPSRERCIRIRRSVVLRLLMRDSDPPDPGRGARGPDECLRIRSRHPALSPMERRRQRRGARAPPGLRWSLTLAPGPGSLPTAPAGATVGSNNSTNSHPPRRRLRRGSPRAAQSCVYPRLRSSQSTLMQPGAVGVMDRVGARPRRSPRCARGRTRALRPR